mgnify:CR=1 FL=1
MDLDEYRRIQRDASAIGLVSLSKNYSDGESEKDIRESDIIRNDKSKDPITEAQKALLNAVNRIVVVKHAPGDGKTDQPPSE